METGIKSYKDKIDLEKIKESKFLKAGDKDAFFYGYFFPLIHDRIKERFPDAYLVSNTIDPEVYKNCNKAIYPWYISIINGLQNIGDHWKYKRTFDDYKIGNSYFIFEMYEDFKNSSNPIEWLVENVGI